jgi:hypothetical protein
VGVLIDAAPATKVGVAGARGHLVAGAGAAQVDAVGSGVAPGAGLCTASAAARQRSVDPQPALALMVCTCHTCSSVPCCSTIVQWNWLYPHVHHPPPPPHTHTGGWQYLSVTCQAGTHGQPCAIHFHHFHMCGLQWPASLPCMHICCA